MPSVEAHGPVDFLMIEYSEGSLRGATSAAIVDLLNRGVVTLYDLAAVRRTAEGAVENVDLTEEMLGGLGIFADLRSGLLTDDDLEAAAAVLEPGTLGLLLVYENTWAAPFVAAALSEGGTPVATTRIPALDVIAALDALEAQD